MARVRGVGHTIVYDGRIMDPFSKGEPIPSGRWSSATQRTLVIAGGDSPEWMPRAAAKVGMELAGLEPATSWVRYRVREPNRGDLMFAEVL